MASKREEPAEPKKEVIEEAAPPEPPISEAIARQSARTLARGMRATRRSNSKLKEFFLKILPRLLPSSDTETPFEMPGWVMAATAIGIPLIVVTIASVVYFSMGRTLEYNQAFEEAKVAYNLALQQTDPVSERTAWEAVQEELNKVEEHGVTPETEQMRAEAQSHLDALLGILRLDYYPAVTSIPSYVKIVSMDASDTELFMLSDTGEIHRAYLVADGYQYDPDFECRKGNHGGKTIDALVAMVALPKANAMGASVMGVDAKGDLLYCASGQTPQATDLMDPPQLQGVTDIALDGDTLYLLDASVPDIWYYQGQAATFVNSFTNTFFKNPPEGMELEYAVEMAVKEGELYLLFKTGTLAHCVSSTLDTVPMRCTNSVQLVDSHLAAGGGTPFNKEIFTQMLISTPPDSALLLLAPKTQTVFRLSPRSFTLLHQLQPIEGTLRGEEIDAIATSAGHIIFVAQDNEVFMVKDIR